MRSAFLTLTVALAATACTTTETPTGVRSADMVPSFAEAGKSDCHIVAGTISETGVFPNFSGTIAGDLVGTTNTTLLDSRITGAAVYNPAERTLAITGGSVSELVGTTLHETFEALTILEAHPLFRINGRTRVDAGAERGNLTEHGTLNVAPFPWEVEVHYQGVICP